MKKLILLFVAIVAITSVNGQILKRLGDRAKNKMEQKAGDKVDKSIDDAVDGKKKEKKEAEETTSTDNNNNSEETSTSSSSSPGSSTEPATLKVYSKYDFVPGEKVFAYEDFSTAEIGDFPTRWNTNGTGEVVTLNSKPGK